jgi:hypothetical protein
MTNYMCITFESIIKMEELGRLPALLIDIRELI